MFVCCQLQHEFLLLPWFQWFLLSCIDLCSLPLCKFNSKLDLRFSSTVQISEVKWASCEIDKKISHMENRVHLESLGWGVLRGTCHMLSESGLKQKPSKFKQDRQPDPPCNGGGEIQGTMCVQASVFAKWRGGRCGNLFFFWGGALLNLFAII